MPKGQAAHFDINLAKTNLLADIALTKERLAHQESQYAGLEKFGADLLPLFAVVREYGRAIPAQSPKTANLVNLNKADLKDLKRTDLVEALLNACGTPMRPEQMAALAKEKAARTLTPGEANSSFLALAKAHRIRRLKRGLYAALKSNNGKTVADMALAAFANAPLPTPTGRFAQGIAIGHVLKGMRATDEHLTIHEVTARVQAQVPAATIKTVRRWLGKNEFEGVKAKLTGMTSKARWSAV